MVLAADAGNTNIKLAVFDQNKLIMTDCLPSKKLKTPEDYRQRVLGILLENGINAGGIDAIVVSTVVPEETSVFLAGLRQMFSIDPLIVNSDTAAGIKILTDAPSELGADRLVNAAAAFHEYEGPLLVIDFGTATTYDVVTENGEFLGGIIAPGVRICAEALWEKTAMLPEIAIEMPDRVMGTNTVDSMKSGIFFGYLGQVEYLVHHLKKELQIDFKVIATGGLSEIFKGETNAIDIFDRDLTLKGLNYISHMNHFVSSAASQSVQMAFQPMNLWCGIAPR